MSRYLYALERRVPRTPTAATLLAKARTLAAHFPSDWTPCTNPKDIHPQWKASDWGTDGYLVENASVAKGGSSVYNELRLAIAAELDRTAADVGVEPRAQKTDDDDSRSADCRFAVVGAGAGGVYAAWRLATAAEQPVPTHLICVFERLPRVGGRTYTLHDRGPRADLQVDLGATVFCDCLPVSDSCGQCNGMQTPLMKGVIQQALHLPTVRYRYPSYNGSDYKGCSKIVSAAGTRENAGFATYIEAMANESAALGVRYYFTHDLQQLVAPAPGTSSAASTLKFGGGAIFTATSVLLNLPVLPLNKLVHTSPSLQPHLERSQFGGAFLRVPHGFRLFKLLLHYDWAWWRSLGLLDGSFTSGECDSGGCPLCTCDQILPLQGRYHDAHVICDDGNETGNNCRGFIQAVYTSDGSHSTAVSAWETWAAGGTSPPHQSFTNTSGGDSAWLLRVMHQSLLAAHRTQLDAKGLTAAATAALPSEAHLLLWDPKTEGFGAATHGMTPGPILSGCGKSQGPCHLQSSQLGTNTVTQLAAHPFKATGLRLFIANEAYHTSDWGEGSMQMAENILAREYQIGRPPFVTPQFYKTIQFPNSTEAPPAPPPAPPGPDCPQPTGINQTTICFGPAVDSAACTGLLSCPAGTKFAKVDFASIGLPTGVCGAFRESSSCHGAAGEAVSVVAKLCVGKSRCSITATTAVLNPTDPSICPGVYKRTAVQLYCA